MTDYDFGLQAIGFNEEAFGEATEEQRIEWAKKNTTPAMGLCGSALCWLKKHKDNVFAVVYVNDILLKSEGKIEIYTNTNIVYRLDPDYQPIKKKWWFNTDTLKVSHSAVSLAHDIEVSEELATYLKTKPCNDSILRVAKRGDLVLTISGEWRQAPCNYSTPTYRWCYTENEKAISADSAELIDTIKNISTEMVEEAIETKESFAKDNLCFNAIEVEGYIRGIYTLLKELESETGIKFRDYEEEK